MSISNFIISYCKFQFFCQLQILITCLNFIKILKLLFDCICNLFFKMKILLSQNLFQEIFIISWLNSYLLHCSLIFLCFYIELPHVFFMCCFLLEKIELGLINLTNQRHIYIYICVCVCVCQKFDRLQRKLTNPILSRHLFFCRKFCSLRNLLQFFYFIYLFFFFLNLFVFGDWPTIQLLFFYFFCFYYSAIKQY